jgi:hypothetical protein
MWYKKDYEAAVWRSSISPFIENMSQRHQARQHFIAQR